MEGIEQWKTEAQQWLRQGIEYAHQIPPTQLYAAVAVLLFTTLLLLIIRLLKRTKSNTIVLSGLSGSGKTVLFLFTSLMHLPASRWLFTSGYCHINGTK
ncbi:hypothetical protein OIU78_012838 [Salix suchowensis]|nr:hypothetical protein OIU78_012838 [Salix suchowensis]